MDLKKLWMALNTPRTIPALLVFSSSPEKQIIKEDIAFWVEVMNLKDLKYRMWQNLHYLMLFCPEFRNLFYYRIKKSSLLLSKLLAVFYLPLSTLYIHTDSIGPGLFIQHGFCTGIGASSIGKNCWINQQVTIGFSKEDDIPVIGDNVRISAGAKVIGDITIGNNSIIGANAVVVKDVPENCTVVGVPAYIVKRNGVKVSRKKDNIE